MKQIELFDLDTKEVLSFSSIKECSKYFGVQKDRLDPLINGKAIKFKNFILNSRRDEILKWKDEFGRVYCMTLPEFISSFGLYYSPKAYNVLILKHKYKKDHNKYIEFELFNLKTGAKVKTFSLKQFCESVGLNKAYDSIHLYPVVRGQRFQHKDWCLTKTAEKVVNLKDKFGNEYTDTVVNLLNKYGMTYHQISRVLNGGIGEGVHLSDKEVKYIPRNPLKVKKYKFTTPNGKVVQGKSIVAVSKQLGDNVSYTSLIAMTSGQTDSRKGYGIKEIELERQYALKEKTC